MTRKHFREFARAVAFIYSAQVHNSEDKEKLLESLLFWIGTTCSRFNDNFNWQVFEDAVYNLIDKD